MVYSGSRPSRWCSYEKVPAARVIEQEFLSFYFLLLLEVVFFLAQSIEPYYRIISALLSLQGQIHFFSKHMI